MLMRQAGADVGYSLTISVDSRGVYSTIDTTRTAEKNRICRAIPDNSVRVSLVHR